MLTIKKNTPLTKEIMSLYKSAFPLRERVSFLALKLQKSFNSFHFNAYYDNDTFVGFIFYRESKKAVFLNYFATASEFRNKGYGKQILLWAIKNIQTERPVLHVAGWNEKAIALYKSVGFEITETIEIK